MDHLGGGSSVTPTREQKQQEETVNNNKISRQLFLLPKCIQFSGNIGTTTYRLGQLEGSFCLHPLNASSLSPPPPTADGNKGTRYFSIESSSRLSQGNPFVPEIKMQLHCTICYGIRRRDRKESFGTFVQEIVFWPSGKRPYVSLPLTLDGQAEFIRFL